MRKWTFAIPAIGWLLAASVGGAETPTPRLTPARVVFPGSLDRSFGSGGIIDDPAVAGVIFETVLVQPDGKIVAVGNGVPTSVARFESSGVLDRSFARGGVVPPESMHGGGYGAALTPDGKLVVIGSGQLVVEDASHQKVIVQRLNADGRVDQTFAGGVTAFDVGPFGFAVDVLVQSSGRIVVLASSDDLTSSIPNGAIVLIGLRDDGTLDPTFGKAGFVRITRSERDAAEADAMIEDTSGRLVVVGTWYTDTVPSGRIIDVRRFDRNGSAPKRFAVVQGIAVDAAQQSNGALVVAGARYDDASEAQPALIRFDGDGTLSDGFGNGGTIDLGLTSFPGAVAIDADNRIVVAGDVVSRRNAGGALDASFGNGGVAIGPSFPGYRDVALQPDGKIVAAGGYCISSKFGTACISSLARYETSRTQLCGDANDDGAFSVTDGVATLRAAAGLASVCDTAICDVDGSGTVGVTDGVNVLRAAADLPALLSCGIP